MRLSDTDMEVACDQSLHAERSLARALGSLQFLEREHQAILTGLHLQIATLTQRCSDLQFSLAMQVRR